MWTFPPQHILVPVDFGDASARAMAIAALIAARHTARVTVLHAETVEVPPYFTHDQLDSVERHRLEARGEAERYLARFAATVLPDAATAFVDGSPVPAILAAANDVDLIVMGTHGRRGPSRWWMGSVAERVVRESRVPVLVTRALAAASGGATTFQHIVGAAGPGFDGDVRHYADGLAATLGATVASTLVTSLDDLSCDPNTSLVVVGTQPQHAGTWFGDTAERLVRTCTLPMLFVPVSQ